MLPGDEQLIPWGEDSTVSVERRVDKEAAAALNAPQPGDLVVMFSALPRCAALSAQAARASARRAQQDECAGRRGPVGPRLHGGGPRGARAARRALAPRPTVFVVVDLRRERAGGQGCEDKDGKGATAGQPPASTACFEV